MVDTLALPSGDIMKINITDDLAVGYTAGDYVLINTDGNVEAVSGNTTFNDEDTPDHVPKGSYAVWLVGDGPHEEQLGCCLEFIGYQHHFGGGEYQEWEEGNLPTNKEK